MTLQPIFAQAETTWAAVVMTALLLLGQFFLWLTGKRRGTANTRKLAQQTEEVREMVCEHGREIATKADRIERNTNGITEQLAARTGELRETRLVLRVAIEKLRKYDASATIIQVADEMIERTKPE